MRWFRQTQDQISCEPGKGLLRRLRPLLLHWIALASLTGCYPAGVQPTGDTPAYEDPVRTPLPEVVPAALFPDQETKAAYEAAARNKPLLAQLPCYCYCDRSKGHTSLLSCFRSDHGSKCSICQREALFADRQAKAGKSPAEIRSAIVAQYHPDREGEKTKQVR